MTIHIRSMIANHQTLNQAVYERRALRAELRRLREPSIRIGIEGNELMPTGCDKQLPPFGRQLFIQLFIVRNAKA